MMLPNLNEEAFSLSAEQRFTLEKVRRDVKSMTRKELEELALKAATLAESRQSMIRWLLKEVLPK